MMISASGSMQQQDAPMMHLDPRMQMKTSPPSSSRILYDIPCKVCKDHSSGKHYGIFACDGCAGFFKRSIRRNRKYVCKAKVEGTCIVDKTHRNQCRACRLAKCKEAGMNKDAVQHERGPRNSTLRRQMALYFKDPSDSMVASSSGPVLDLALPKPDLPPTGLDLRTPFIPHPGAFLCNPGAIIPKPPTVPLFPALLPPPDSAESIREQAARLLFMNVRWVKNVLTFTTLPIADQLLLLEESWRELFILGAAQFMIPMELNPLLQTSEMLSNPESSLPILREIKIFQDLLVKFSKLLIDPNEFVYLRAIALFKTSFDLMEAGSSASSSTPRYLTDLATVANLQEHTQLTLHKHITASQPGGPLRFSKLLLLLPELKTVSNKTIVELFFKRTIGNIPIEKIICDMYKGSNV